MLINLKFEKIDKELKKKQSLFCKTIQWDHDDFSNNENIYTA